MKTRKIIFPLENYKISGAKFLQNVSSWGIHLGEDCKAKAGDAVKSIYRGEIVYSALHPGSSQKGNWGNIIIIRHKLLGKGQIFYSLYGHLGKGLENVGDKVKKGELVGYMGKAYSAENGWWPAHLHFAIYTGPWSGKILPGYYRKEQNRTKLSYWKNPTEWILKNSK